MLRSWALNRRKRYPPRASCDGWRATWVAGSNRKGQLKRRRRMSIGDMSWLKSSPRGWSEAGRGEVQKSSGAGRERLRWSYLAQLAPPADGSDGYASGYERARWAHAPPESATSGSALDAIGVAHDAAVPIVGKGNERVKRAEVAQPARALALCTLKPPRPASEPLPCWRGDAAGEVTLRRPERSKVRRGGTADAPSSALVRGALFLTDRCFPLTMRPAPRTGAPT